MNALSFPSLLKSIKIFVCLSVVALINLGFQSEQQSTHPSSSFNDSLEYVSDLGASHMSISGTSSLHDWESNVGNFKITTHWINDRVSANLIVHVNSIKSHSKVMDKNTYKALMLDSYPSITLVATGLTVVNNKKITGHGDLTVAGTTKQVPLELTITALTENSMTVTSEIPIQMTDYGVDPPVALLGTIKTGDEIKIKFNIKSNLITHN